MHYRREKIAYKKLNIKTLIQRISGVMIILLLPIHILSFPLLESTAGGTGYIIVEALQIIYYGSLSCHVAMSFTNALASIAKMNRKKRR